MRINTKAARKAEFERDFTKFSRAVDGGFACNCCFEPAYHFSDSHKELYEYGYNCNNGHIICYKCWCALNKERIVGPGARRRRRGNATWKCPTCREYVPFHNNLPNGIIKEGGLVFQKTRAWYLKQGKQVVFYPFNYDSDDCAGDVD